MGMCLGTHDSEHKEVAKTSNLNHERVHDRARRLSLRRSRSACTTRARGLTDARLLRLPLSPSVCPCGSRTQSGNWGASTDHLFTDEGLGAHAKCSRAAPLFSGERTVLYTKIHDEDASWNFDPRPPSGMGVQQTDTSPGSPHLHRTRAAGARTTSKAPFADG